MLRRSSLFWRLWFRAISVKRPQAGLALGSLLVGAALAATLLNLHTDIRRKMTQEFRAYGANVVLAPVVPPGDFAAPGLLDEDVIARLSPWQGRIKGLGYAPLLHVVMRLRRVPDDPRLPEFQNAVAVGTDFAALRSLYPAWRLEGRAALGTGECVVGVHVASQLLARVGDSILLESADSVANERLREPQSLRIAGVLSTGSAEDDQVFVPLGALQQLAGLTGKVSLIELSVPGEPAAVEEVMKEMDQSLPGVEVRAVRGIVASQGKVLETIRWLLVSLTALILVTVALCVTATMTAIVLERKRDIAVMKALGATDRLVMRLFLSESAALGLLAGLAGFGLGWAAAQFLGHRLFDVGVSPTWWTLPLVCLLTAGLALLATVFPVQFARTVEPAATLKGE